MADSKTLSEGYLVDTLVACQTFVNLCVGNDAEGCVYVRRLPRPESGAAYTRAELEGLRPYALIECVDAETDSRAESVNSDGSWDTVYGPMKHRVVICRNTPVDAEGSDDVDCLWDEIVRGIEKELNELKGVGGYLAFTKSKVMDVGRTHPTDVAEEGDAQYGVIELITEVAI